MLEEQEGMVLLRPEEPLEGAKAIPEERGGTVLMRLEEILEGGKLTLEDKEGTVLLHLKMMLVNEDYRCPRADLHSRCFVVQP